MSHYLDIYSPTNKLFNKERIEIKCLFSWAHRRLLVATNPVHPVDKFAVETPKKAMPIPKQMAEMLMAAGPNRPLLLVLFHTLAGIDEVLYRFRFSVFSFRLKNP